MSSTFTFSPFESLQGGQCGENLSASGDARGITVRYLACASRGITGITGRPHEGVIRHSAVKL